MRYTLYTIALLIFFGCEEENDKYWHNEIEDPISEVQIYEWESEHGEKVDTLFLSYTFGMSDTEFKKESSKLITQGKLENINGDLIYKLTVDGFTYNFELIPTFNSGELYELGLLATEYQSSRFIDALKVARLYNDKYFLPNIRITDDENFSYMNWRWIKGNMLVEVRTYANGIGINYTDYIVKSALLNAEEQRNQEKESAALDDI